MSPLLEKVTAFITRTRPAGPELLLFQHPNAGIQIPAGTVEPDEGAEHAALREAEEEVGLADLSVAAYLGATDTRLPPGRKFILSATPVYSRPDPASIDWARLRRGHMVEVVRATEGFVQVSYVEHDRWPDPQFVTMQITGWVPDSALTDWSRRHFFHLECRASTPDEWSVRADNHVFRPFWAGFAALPPIISPQNEWLSVLRTRFPDIPKQ